MTRTLSIAIKENTYQELKSKIGLGKISSFVNKAVEKELSELEKEQKKEKEKLRQQLIKSYQSRTKNKKLQAELRAWGNTSIKDVFSMLKKRENGKNK